MSAILEALHCILLWIIYLGGGGFAFAVACGLFVCTMSLFRFFLYKLGSLIDYDFNFFD